MSASVPCQDFKMSDENRSPAPPYHQHLQHATKVVELMGEPPWGFRIQGGKDSSIPLKVARVNPGSKAAKCGIRDGDLISSINGQTTEELTNAEVQKIIKKSGDRVTLELKGASKRMGTLDGSPGLSSPPVTEAPTSLSTSQLNSSSSSGPAVSVPSSAEEPKESTSSPPVSTPPLTKAEKKERKKSEKKKKGQAKEDKAKKGKHQQTPPANQPSPPQFRKEPKVNVTSLASGEHKCIGDGVGLGGSGSNLWVHDGSAEEHEGKQHSNYPPTSFGSKGNGKISGVSSSLLGDIIAELDDLLDADFFNGSTNFNEGVWPPQPGAPAEVAVASPKRTVPGVPVLPLSNNVGSSSCSDLPALEPGSENIPPVWTPPSAQPSPSSQKKFRPVNFNVPGSPKSSTPRTLSLDRSSSSPQLPVRQSSLQQQQAPAPPRQSSFPLQSASQEQTLLSQKEVVSSPEQNDNSSRSDSVYQSSGGSISTTHHQSSSSQSTVNLPKYQSPTVTLLQKAREGQLPKGAHYLEQSSPSVRRRGSSENNRSRPTPVQYSPVGLTLELDSNTTGKRVTDKGVEFDGIGPITPEGVPIATRPAIKSEQQHQWYKRMYESLHVERPQRRGPRFHSAGHSAGHYSEPEGYESDTYAYNRYATLDRRKLRERYSESTDCFSPSPSTPNSILSPTYSCPPSGIRFNPGRIEDYTPGNSCVIAKQIRQHKPTLQWALGSRDLGYESDSNLIVRKRSGINSARLDEEPEYQGIKSPPPPPLSPAEQRQLYVDIQKGGEVPLQGLRKPAPERPKEFSWLHFLRFKVSRSMPTFDEMKRSLPSFTRGRSTSRSGSPVCKSPPPNSTVALLQERIQEKIRRSNSDLSPRPSDSFRSRYGLSGIDASRIIHTVRSTTQTLRRAGSSSIPIRSRETSVEKLRVSSPELMSPREVKKAMQGNGTTHQQHRLSIKYEVTKTSPLKKKEGEVKKSGLKKANGKTPAKNGAVQSKQKSVKISDKVSIENNSHRSTTSISNKNGSVPVKPPRKIKTASSSPPTSFIEQGKVHKVGKVSPAASRHASCLSPRSSRPTSPGGLSSVSNSSLHNITPSKTGSDKMLGSSGKSATTLGIKRKSEGIGVVGKSPPKKLGERKSLKSAKDEGKQEKEKYSLQKSRAASSSPAKIKSASGSEIFTKESLHSDLEYSSLTNRREEESLGYWTIPPRKLRRDISAFERPSLFSFRSLPALTPYLTETKRVSQSLFLTKQLPLVRPTKTSAMREKLAHDPFESLPIPQSKCVRSTARSPKKGESPGRIVRSVSCLTLKEKLIRDYTYTNYILELQHARKRSPRFLQLHRLYSSLERLGQLERSTSLYDIPVLSNEKQLDFDCWWKVRNRLRVEEEMSSILNLLMNAQRNREFFFRPKSPEQVRWKGDSALRCKQWNIDELRHFLLTGELKSRNTSASDLHKTAWRGTSVKEVALNMEVASSLSKNSEYYYYRDKHADFTRTPALRRAFSMSSTLSDDQKEKIKSRLGTLIIKRDKDDGSRSESKTNYNTIPTVRTSRMGTVPPLRNSPSPESDIGVDGSLTETAKRQISKTISEEVFERKKREKAEQENYFQQRNAEVSGNVRSISTGESESDSSMRTVIHIPVSTKMLLRKCQEQQQQGKEGPKGKSPVYPVYCTKGVPSKVSFFETFHKDTNNNKEPIVAAEAKIIKTKSYPERVRLEGKEKKEVKIKAPPARAKSPAVMGGRSRSVTPERAISPRPFDNRYMSHINVISKLASLLLKKDNSLKNLVQREVIERDRLERLRMINAGEVDRLKNYFEDHVVGDFDSAYFYNHPEVSLLRCLFCSDPNLARLTEKVGLGHTPHHTRRCASADIFKEKLDYFERGDRIRPDGKESSPVHSRSPELYFSSRSRKPIYQPSSTPNICQPTLTAHCFLESPTKSMEFDTSCYSSDFSGNYWDYHSTSPAPSSTAIPYSPPPRRAKLNPARTSTPIAGGTPVRSQSQRESYSTIQPRILESRVQPPNISELGKNWNFDPALHQPKYRYVPPPPIIEQPPKHYPYYTRIGSSYPSLQQPSSLPPNLLAPPVPPPPGTPYYHPYQPGRLQKSESFHVSSTSHLSQPHQTYRSVHYPTLRGRQGTTSREFRQAQSDGLQLQRSASLNYAKAMVGPAPPKSPDYGRNIKSLPSPGGTQVEVANSSNVTDIESQIQQIETQFGESGSKNGIKGDDESSAPANITDATAAVARRMLQLENASTSSPVRYAESEVNIHYKAPIRAVEKEFIPEDELRRRQEIAMRRFYEEQRQRKMFQEIQDIQDRRHMDNFTPSQKSPIPLNRYDDVIDELPTKTSWRREKTPESTRLAARALYNFSAQNHRELAFRKGDIIFIRRKIDSNWYEGEHNAAVGIFPCSYVEVIPAFDIERATPRTQSEGQAKVRFNFTAATPAEMSIIKGETVVLTRKVDANWYEGRIGARRGIFPSSYVLVIREPGGEMMNYGSAKSPKPIGAPAAHSLVQQQNGGGIMYNTSKHSYKHNEYSLGADLSNIDAFINEQIQSSNAGQQYRKENIYQPSHTRNRYAQNLTIDTRIEPIQYRAVYNYKPAHEDELELRESDLLHVIETCEDGWLVGTSQRTGLFGTFPGNYVERVF